VDFVHRLSTCADQEKTDIKQALRTNHGRKLDELRPCYTDRFDVYIKLSLMNSALEFHDSEVGSVRRSGGSVTVAFKSVYLHRSAGRPGVDAGAGYVEPGELLFSDAQCTERGGACIGYVSEGVVSAEGSEFANVVPLPLNLAGRVSAKIAFTSGAVLEITGSAVSYMPTGASKFVEAYEG